MVRANSYNIIVKETKGKTEMTQVTVIAGSYRNMPIQNQTFELIEGIRSGKSGSWITVNTQGLEGFFGPQARIKVEDENSFRIEISEDEPADDELQEAVVLTPSREETDEEVIERLRTRFSMLDVMANAALDGVIRGLVIAGPPGVGKTHGIEKIIDDANSTKKISNTSSNYGIEKGAATSAIGLYQMLYHYSAAGSLLVMDDSDGVLYDDEALNLLKAALDSGKRRFISWRKESKVLEREAIPDSFEFKGSVIFITNLKLEHARGKVGDHLKAILSRCHYLDLTVDTAREKFLRCKQIVQDGMLRDYGFTQEQQDELLDFIHTRQNRLREVSLRMVSKIADLMKMDSKNWKLYAETTCTRR